MARSFIYHMQGLTKSYAAGKKLLEGINLSFYPDAKIGVLGSNGSGKSTLLRIMAGIDTEFTGEARVAKGATVGYLPQEPTLDPSLTVRENVMQGVKSSVALLERYNAVAMEMAENYTDEIMEEMTTLQDEIDGRDLWNLDSKVDQAMEALRCPEDNASVEHLSGGERRRVALCRLLLEQPDLLLLDEPTNHLDAETTGWLEKHLVQYPGAVLIVTHDRYFLDNVTGWILEIDRGRGIPFEGNYSLWLSHKRKRLEQESKEDKARQRQLNSEEEWLKSSVRARQTKSKARIRSYDELLSRSNERVASASQMAIPIAERLGRQVIDLNKLNKAFGERLLIEDLTLKMPPGAVVGIIGANGSGKTTLFRMIMSEETPDSGDITLGSSVSLGYSDQSRDDLKSTDTIWESISDKLDVIHLGKREVNSRAYCSSFGFKGTDQQKKVGDLSGGERNRVQLARTLKSGANVMLLDEPTNDLDVATLRALEDAIEDYAGCVLVISHDRFFLDRLATHILAFEGDSHVEWFEGNFEAYLADRESRLGQHSDPRRIRYKKFTRS